MSSLMASPLHFPPLGFSLDAGAPCMNWGRGLAGFGLAVLITASCGVAPRVLAQTSLTESSKRKIKVRVAPEYPPLAKQLKVTGKVKIEATVTPEGHVTGTKVLGGSPVLVVAALDALKKWRYESAPKETIEIVEFDFANLN
jgi:TonB family protein